MKIGFTGTRRGMTEEQKTALRAIFEDYDQIEFHHGACCGADEDAVLILISRGDLNDYIVAHPGHSAKDASKEFESNTALIASQSWRTSKPHFERNRNIVIECDLIIGAPPCEPLPEFGGTAYTINFAKKMKKDTLIIWPTGFVE